MIDDPTRDVLLGAASGRREPPLTAQQSSDLASKYDRMLHLAGMFDAAAGEMRQRAGLGGDILGDPAFVATEPLSPRSYAETVEDLRRTAGLRGLETSSAQLAADALVLRATVVTYRWIDELQLAAFRTLGTIAGRAIGYLAPEIALGGAVVSAGLIETDALDREDVAAYLDELAKNNPELLEHVTSGGGGLLDGLQMRSLLTAGVLSGDQGRLAGLGGLRAAGVTPFAADFGSALRDTAGGLIDASSSSETRVDVAIGEPPRTVADLMSALGATSASVAVQRLGDDHYIAYLPGPEASDGSRLRLMSGADRSAYAAGVVRAIESALEGDDEAHVMLVGSGQGGVTAAEIAADGPRTAFVIDAVVTAGAPSAHVPRIPQRTRVLSLENRSDPVAVLGSLMSASTPNRLTVVFDAAGTPGESVYVTGGRAVDGSSHPELRHEIGRLQGLGFLRM
ncbi:hypothetical protein NPS01_12230 [Nocardioides psychrotolerans]|uniref:Uncharacterized protein n=1 Tax=Nocardioides psychrotolerans TaxID=1005945 RepID=A0A1I3E0M7_9ACTN|nr:hypothetical protein [Nocardioides psychrotolerans]GEP37560.1 hypothetical protein NPS01_12230 [Nocardioides psychrotolerans]SFH92527.1 hypothetical protein SAMN05216561_103168 [Nocardioides psychrotolerans]